MIAYLKRNWREVGWTYGVFVFASMLAFIWFGLTLTMWFIPPYPGNDITLRQLLVVQARAVVHKMHRLY